MAEGPEMAQLRATTTGFRSHDQARTTTQKRSRCEAQEPETIQFAAMWSYEAPVQMQSGELRQPSSTTCGMVPCSSILWNTW